MTLYVCIGLILQMNRRVGDVRGAKQTLAAGFAGAIFRAPVTKWAREEREGPSPLVSCVRIRVSDQLEGCCGAVFPHIIVTSATLRSLNSFSRLREMMVWKRESGRPFCGAGFPL